VVKKILLSTLLLALGLLILVALLPCIIMLPLMWLADILSGERTWCLEQSARMQTDRPALSDTEFLRSEIVEERDPGICLAVRRVMADSVGLPRDAIYPQDRMADLWRMQWFMPDLLDVVFRLERALGVKISRQTVDRHCSGVYGPELLFCDFVAIMVTAIAESQQRKQA
jgi:hypothetical protein